MNKFSMVMISLVGMASIVFAQGAQKPATPATPAAPAAGAPAKAPATPATPATPAAKQPAPGAPAVPPPAKVELPKPPAEISTTLKQMGTRSNCTGTGLGPDMKTMVKFKGVSTAALALDGWWIKGSMTGTMGEGKAATKMKMDTYMTWDAKAMKWRTLGMMNDGTSMVGTSDMKDGKLEGVSDTWGPMGQGQFKDHGDMTDPKAGSKMWGEMSVDKGRTWIKVYEMTCKK